MMKKTQIKDISKKSRWLWIAVVGGLVFSGVLVLSWWIVYHGTAPQSSMDAQRRQKIEKMAADFRANFPDVVEMESRRAMDLIKDKKIIFIDVRQPKEQAVSMLPEAITHKVYLENSDKYDEYIKISYCTIGYRSGQFAQILKRKGIPIYNLHGGMLAWVHDGGKVYDKNGQSFRIHVYGRPWELAPEGYQEVW